VVVCLLAVSSHRSDPRPFRFLRPLPAPARPSVLVLPVSLFSRHTLQYPLLPLFASQFSTCYAYYNLTLPLYPYCAVGEAGSLNTGWV
jgi:hypothetical protein